MRSVILVMLLVMLAALPPVLAQDRSGGFAGLGLEAGDGFKAVTPDYRPQFPRDYGAHPGFRVEWWYITANLKTSDGKPLGVQWTLFRTQTKPTVDGQDERQWSDRTFWMAHAAVTDATFHRYGEKLARGGVSGQAGAALQGDRFDLWLDDWAMTGTPDAFDLRAGGKDFSYDLSLSAEGREVLHGTEGVSVKSEEGQASYYFSNPSLWVSGTVILDGQALQVSGHAWLDREWSSQFLSDDQDGWDWFSVRLDDGHKLMAFRLRSKSRPPYVSGSWILPDGTVKPLSGADLTITPQDGQGSAPQKWRIALPAKGIDLDVRSLNRDAWMRTLVPYYEGPVLVSGSHRGEGYLEMTGYQIPVQ